MIKVLAGPALILFTLLILSKTLNAAGDVVINEFVAHPSTGNKEWVEFANPNSLDLTSYYLDDDTDFENDTGSSAKKSLSTLETSNPNYPYLEFASFLNNTGDYVVLFSPDGTLLDQYQYTNDPGTDAVIGRSPDGVGDFVTLAVPTKGSANAEPLPSPSPTPTPDPSPSPSPQTQSSTSNTSNSATTNSSKSPSPITKPAATAPVKSPSPKPKNSPTILSSQDEQPVGLANTQQSPSPSPHLNSQKSTPNIKIAVLL